MISTFLDFHFEIYAWLRGATLVLSIIYFLIYAQSNKKEYLYYSLYLLTLFILFLKYILPINYIPTYQYINYPLQFLAYTFYILFARNLLKTKKHIPNWDIILVLATKVLLVFIPIFILFQYFFGNGIQEKLFFIIVPVFTVFSLLSYIVIAKIKGKHVLFFIIGSLFLLLFANLSLLTEVSFKNFLVNELRFQPFLLMHIGVLFETFMVALILGYKLKYQEEKRHKAEYLLDLKIKEKANLKMTALQSQMDPHFLYNSLNSINNFVLKNDAEKASDYITKFSRLIREILNNSSNMTISLAKELGILNLYIKLEQMRINDGFDYILVVDETLDIDNIEVPPLFLQPFVENAIWHGLANKKGKKKIKLQIYNEGKNIRCELIDNGIGINKTMNENNYLKGKRKSFGVKATEDRIKLLHKNAKVYLIIEDISNETTTGTKVTLKFPKHI